MDDNTIRRYVKGHQNRGLRKYLTDGYIPFSGKLRKEQEKALSGNNFMKTQRVYVHTLKENLARG